MKGTKMSKKPAPLDLADEDAERAKFAGMTKGEIETAVGALRLQKSKSSQLSGTLSGKLGVFESQGGHKAALKMAERLTGMEPAECADFMRSFIAYFDALGGNEQIDMFDQASEKTLNEDSISVASNGAQPETGAEPLH